MCPPLVLGCWLFLPFSMANKHAYGSRSAAISRAVLLPQVSVEGNEAEGGFVGGSGSCAHASLPVPWRRAASAVGAPVPNPPVLCCRSPDLEEDPFLFFFHESHRGGGFKKDGKWSLRSHLRGCGSSTPAMMVELWRPLWLPASSTSPVNPMAERRPFRAMATGLHRPLLVFFLLASMPKGRQCINGFESISSISGGRRSGGDPGVPSGLVPGDDGCESELLLLFGPDCNSRSWVRVLSACSRDLYVIFCFSLYLVVRCCVPPPET